MCHKRVPPFSEKARRLVDLVTTSVLLDAGAGDVWKYAEKSTGFEAGRSEGLGVASFHMFGAGAFSSDPGSNPHRADSVGLKDLEDDSVRTAFQVDDASNPLVGCEGRTQVCLCCFLCAWVWNAYALSGWMVPRVGQVAFLGDSAVSAGVVVRGRSWQQRQGRWEYHGV